MAENGTDPSQEMCIRKLTNQLNQARNEINNLRQQIKNLHFANKKEYENIQQVLTDWQSSSCKERSRDTGQELAVQLANNSDASFTYIGVIHTEFPEKRATPRQASVSNELTAKLVLNNSVLTNPEHALEGLHGFSHMWILFHFHKNDSTHIRAKVMPPRMNGLRTGVFSTRSPHRPCPIGLSLVRIDRIQDNIIYFNGVDMIDKTPVFDIKPYIPQYDSPSTSNPSIYQLLPASNLEQPPEDALPPDTITDEVLGASSTRIMDGEETGAGGQDHIVTATHHGRNSRIGEREAPDGEENEEANRSSFPSGSRANDSSIRIPTWIDDQSSHLLSVYFKDSAIQQLIQIGEAESDEKLQTINNVLKEDPRSIYLRHRMGANFYVFRIAMLNVSCKFNDTERSVTVFKIVQADDELE